MGSRYPGSGSGSPGQTAWSRHPGFAAPRPRTPWCVSKCARKIPTEVHPAHHHSRVSPPTRRQGTAPRAPRAPALSRPPRPPSRRGARLAQRERRASRDQFYRMFPTLHSHFFFPAYPRFSATSLTARVCPPHNPPRRHRDLSPRLPRSFSPSAVRVRGLARLFRRNIGRSA